MKKTVLLLVGSTCLALLGLEVFFRFYAPPRLPKPRVGVYEGKREDWYNAEVCVTMPDGRICFKPSCTFLHCYDGPGAEDLDADNCVAYSINSWGYRDIERKTGKQGAAYRIAAYGDSFTVGEGVPFERTYPRLLEKALEGKRIEGKPVEVLNFGVPGMYTGEEHDAYKQTREAFRPDLVVLQWNTNDFPAEAIKRDHMKQIGMEYAQVFRDSPKYEWSALVHYIWHLAKMRRIAREMEAVTVDEAAQKAVIFKLIDRFRNDVVADDARFVVLVFPELVRFDDYPYASILDGLRRFCADKRIDLVDLYPLLSQYPPQDLWVHDTDHHPNHVAHGVACGALEAFLAHDVSR